MTQRHSKQGSSRGETIAIKILKLAKEVEDLLRKLICVKRRTSAKSLTGTHLPELLAERGMEDLLSPDLYSGLRELVELRNQVLNSTLESKSKFVSKDEQWKNLILELTNLMDDLR